MSQLEPDSAQVFTYQFEVEIDKPCEQVWRQMIENINEWWLPDFRVLGESSQLTLTAAPGGMLLEEGAGGQFLEWYRVQMCEPGKVLHLVGHLAPDWGGPSTSMLKLALEPTDTGCVLRVAEGVLGRISEASVSSAEAGWRAMFFDSFKPYVEHS